MPITRLFSFMEAMDIGTATWVMAVAVIIMVGAEATITVGDKDGPDHTARGRLNWRPRCAHNQKLASISLKLTLIFRYC